MVNLIQKEDYKIGDRVRITFDVPVISGKIGTVISIKYGAIGVKFEGGLYLEFAFRTSVELADKPVKVVFT